MGGFARLPKYVSTESIRFRIHTRCAARLDDECTDLAMLGAGQPHSMNFCFRSSDAQAASSPGIQLDLENINTSAQFGPVLRGLMQLVSTCERMHALPDLLAPTTGY